MMIIEVEELIKTYDGLTAVDGINFSVDEGKIFAFLGPNGAGKSTTINILCTLLAKDAGKVMVAGYEVGKADHQVRREIGVVFQESILDSRLTAQENLETRARLYGITGERLTARLSEVVDIMGIAEFIHQPYGRLSGGQRRRVDIARALMNTPRILFLDEPTTGLDPQTRAKVWETVRQLRKEQKITVFLTTHYMEEAADADDVVIIDHGTIVARGTPNELKDEYASDTLRVYAEDLPRLRHKLEEMGVTANLGTDMLVIPVKNSFQALSILKNIEDAMTGFEVVKGSMDDVFIKITGRAIREGVSL
ncbi:MAG TPA: ATP-binding cassette domain-containing protein [Bacillota bacterium]|nr:ATP-binding cassette domain-containing protein [Bacillota bacterium]